MPATTGAAVAVLRGGSLRPLLVFLLAAISLFCLRTPLEALLGTSAPRTETAAERRLAGRAMMGRIGEPEEIAGPILFLCTKYAGFITGEIFNVNGGAVLVG